MPEEIPPPMSEEEAPSQSPEDPTQKLTIREIRSLILRINNPEIPVETRQRALTSLLVESIDRLLEGVGTGIRRLSEHDAEVEKKIEKVAADLDELQKQLGGPGVAVKDGAQPNGQARTAVPKKAAPTGPIELPAGSPPAAPAAPPTDPSQIAAMMNGADGLPVAPGAK